MNGGARRRLGGTRRAKPGVASFRSPVASLAVALSLILQLFAVPYHQALSAPLVVPDDTAAIAAELRATFGDAATLCVQADEKSAPQAPGGCCDDQCPFCRFAAQAAALLAPDLPALPGPIGVSRESIGIAPEPGTIPSPPTSRQRARGPPLSV